MSIFKIHKIDSGELTEIKWKIVKDPGADHLTAEILKTEGEQP